MQYRKFGNTGEEISALGFGAMRLPEYEKDGKWFIDEDKAIEMIHRAFDLGVNYIDTAWMYCHDNSQYTVGKAVNSYKGKNKILVSTKLPIWNVKETDDFWRILEEQLKRINVDSIDFYHLHGIGKDSFEDTVLRLNLLEQLEKAKNQGMIKHKSFSFHDKAEVMKTIIDTGAFESVLCQYNLLDRENEEMIKYANDKGLGTVIMGPIAGGRLAVTSETLKGLVGEVSGTPEIALRFVLGNPNVSCALSGMRNISDVEENAEIASREDKLSSDEWKKISDTLEETKALSDLYCTGCDYCNLCPKEINISKLFYIYNLHKVYGITEYAKGEFAKLGVQEKTGGLPSSCIECGLCEKKCPQFIKIPEKIKLAIKELS